MLRPASHVFHPRYNHANFSTTTVHRSRTFHPRHVIHQRGCRPTKIAFQRSPFKTIVRVCPNPLPISLAGWCLLRVVHSLLDQPPKEWQGIAGWASRPIPGKLLLSIIPAASVPLALADEAPSGISLTPNIPQHRRPPRSLPGSGFFRGLPIRCICPTLSHRIYGPVVGGCPKCCVCPRYTPAETVTSAQISPLRRMVAAS